METRHADSERLRHNEQQRTAEELEEKRLILERMQSEADTMKQEAVSVGTSGLCRVSGSVPADDVIGLVRSCYRVIIVTIY